MVYLYGSQRLDCNTNDYTILLLDFAPRPRPSPSSLLLSSSKEGEVLVSSRLTGAMVPPKFHLRILLHARPSFRQRSSHVGRGLGSVGSFSGTKTSLTIRLELHCLEEGFFWPSLSLNWTSTRNEDSNDFNDLRLQKLARVSFVSLIGRRPALQQGSWLHVSQFHN